MFKQFVILLGLLPSTLVAMRPEGQFMGSQLEFSKRHAYVKDRKEQPVNALCIFCDKQTLANNYILNEDNDHDVRIMMNKFPYFDFDQGHHLLVMPISHKEHSHDFSQHTLTQQINTAHNLLMQLSADTYSQEYFTNWGKCAGQSVPHWHSQLKFYTQQPLSLPERAQRLQTAPITTIETAFNLVKTKLELAKTVSIAPKIAMNYDTTKCICCSIKSIAYNFVIAPFKHNYVCLSHYPHTAGELSVVPHRHVAAIKDLSQEEFRENMILAMALLPIMHAYAKEHIRESDGGNLYTKSVGDKAPIKEQQRHHLHTLVIPRTIIAPTPGTINGNSCKLDYDPDHLYEYLCSKKDALYALVQMDHL